MRSLFFFPPLPKVSGGLAVIARLARILAAAGFSVALVPREPSPFPENLAPEVPVLDWDKLDLGPEDIWMVPEGWPNALLPGLRAGARCLVYVQNWAYLLGNLPPHASWTALPARFLAVSRPVAWFVEQVTGQNPELLRPGIDTALFHPEAGLEQDPGRPVTGRLRVAWMPRKNKALARQIREIVTARGLDAEWREIHDRTQAEVADLLRTSHIFLATGFPEGCPLPPLEALASGCVLAGFSGFGGWDYMRQAAAFPGAFTPWWPLEDAPWGGNGFFAADADVTAAALALEQACALLRKGGAPLADLRAASARSIERYTLDAQAQAAVALWTRLTREPRSARAFRQAPDR